jgi:hypothetical protein
MKGNRGEEPAEARVGSARHAQVGSVAALALIVVLSLAACGGGGDGDDNATVTLGEGTYSVTKQIRAGTAAELTSQVPELASFGEVQDPSNSYLVVELDKTDSEKKIGVGPSDLTLVGGDDEEYESVAQSFKGGYETVLLIFDVPEAALDGAELQLEGTAIPLPSEE